jgi:hypothetical protein
VLRSSVLGIFLSLSVISSGNANTEGDAYRALSALAKVTSETVNSEGCLIAATADSDGFFGQIAIFRDAWLNKDFSIDYYSQRRKTFFVYVVLKRLAEALTEELYRGQKPPSCSFAISAKYVDKFGQNKEILALTWKFTQEQNDKINWDKIDPRNFSDVAIDLKVSPEAMAWISDEPGMDDQLSSKTTAGCDLNMLRANAIFMRATTYCTKDYLDSRAGYYALAMARQCKNIDEKGLNGIFLEMAEKVDAVANKYGRAAACRFVDRVEEDVLHAIVN